MHEDAEYGPSAIFTVQNKCLKVVGTIYFEKNNVGKREKINIMITQHDRVGGLIQISK